MKRKKYEQWQFDREKFRDFMLRQELENGMKEVELERKKTAIVFCMIGVFIFIIILVLVREGRWLL